MEEDLELEEVEQVDIKLHFLEEQSYLYQVEHLIQLQLELEEQVLILHQHLLLLEVLQYFHQLHL